MLTDYERELSTHYAQVRKRLGYDQKPKPVFIPKPQNGAVNETELATKQEPEPKSNIDIKEWYRLAHEALPWVKDYDSERKTYKQILKEVAKETGMSEKHITGRSRLKEYVLVRRYFWWRCANELPHMTISDIGRKSNHDHTTILHAIAAYRRDHEGIDPSLNGKGRLRSDTSWRRSEKV